MTKKIILIAFLLGTVNAAIAHNLETPTLGICRRLAMIVWDEVIREGHTLPESWDEIPGIGRIRNDPSVMNPSELAIINTLAIVPHAPEIVPEPGISRDHSERRLFVIGRKSSFDHAPSDHNFDPLKGGRFAILVAPDASDIVATWIPEPEARIILKQIEGFDPSAQSLAFKNIAQLEFEKEERHQRLMKDARKNLIARPSRWNIVKVSASALSAWIAGGVVVFFLLVWLVARKFQR